MDTIVERLSQQAATGVIQAEDLVEQAMSDSTTLGSRVGEEGLTYFTAPICDLFVTVFELREKNNWLRRQAILIVLQQVLGGTIERYVSLRMCCFRSRRADTSSSQQIPRQRQRTIGSTSDRLLYLFTQVWFVARRSTQAQDAAPD